MSSPDPVLRSGRGPVRWLTLNRPEVHNALDKRTLAALRDHLDEAARAPEVRAVVVTGAGGKAFCAGADLDELQQLSPPDAHEFLLSGHGVFRGLETCEKPVVASVRGHVLGGGLELALACHFIIASSDATFSLPEADLGLMPGFGGTQRLLRAISRPRALHMMLSGQRIDAGEAHHLGLLAAAPCAAEELEARAQSFAEELTGASPTATRLILSAVEHAGGNADAGLDHEAALAALALASPEARERMAAFVDRRNRHLART